MTQLCPQLVIALFAAGGERVVMHAGAEHLQPAFACQGVVEREQDDLSQPRLDQLKDRQSDRIQRPACGAEDAVIGREVLGRATAGGADHGGDVPPGRKDPTGQQRGEAVKGWGGHGGGQTLQQRDESWYKLHSEPPCSMPESDVPSIVRRLALFP